MAINVYRENLVAIYIGQTVIKTEQFLKDHTGQTLIFDEPIVFDAQDSFGKEVLDTLNSLKSKYFVVLVFKE